MALRTVLSGAMDDDTCCWELETARRAVTLAAGTGSLGDGDAERGGLFLGKGGSTPLGGLPAGC